MHLFTHDNHGFKGSASITRGIESPKKRTSIIEIRFDIQDIIALIIGVVITAFIIYRSVFYD